MSDYILKEVLMERDDLNEDEAEELIEEMRRDIDEGADPEDVLYDNGLEPDYLEDLLDD